MLSARTLNEQITWARPHASGREAVLDAGSVDICPAKEVA